MPSHRPRSRSRSPNRSHSPEDRPALPNGVSPISESDYFLKSAEFRSWLKEEKGKYFDELTGEKARSYFRKFVKAWNKGKLPKSLYSGIDPSAQSATSQTAYKWDFAANKTRVSDEALQAAREQVSAATYGKSQPHPQPGLSKGGASRRIHGPTLPSASDIVMAREAEAESQTLEGSYRRKRERAEVKERVEDVVGPKEVGREGMVERKRVRREGDKAFRERGDDGFVEADETTLLGGGDSFKERIGRRDAARKRFEEKRNVGREDKEMATRERATAIREKDKATMDMLQQLAKQRFG